MSRINKTIKKRFDGKRFFATPDLPNIPIAKGDIYITASQGTRLDVLAYEYYKNSAYWWIIAKANNIGFGYAVEPGTQLRIPTNIEKYL